MITRFRPGTDTWIESDSLTSAFSGVFEDDGETGYFYAYDRRETQQPILDAVQIYNVANVADREQESEAEIRWSEDGLKAGLFLNGDLHAVLNFETRTAYSRSNFPPPAGTWGGGARERWNDSLAALLQ